MKKIYLIPALILSGAFASCEPDNGNNPPEPPKPSKEAIVLDHSQALYMGDAVDGKTADLRIALFNGAYGAESEEFDYEALVVQAIDEMPASSEEFVITPGKYEFTAEHSGTPGQFVGGSVEGESLNGTYFVKMKDGEKTTYVITGGELDVVKGVNYVVVATLDGYIQSDGGGEPETFEDMEFYYSGALSFEDRTAPKETIVLNKLHSEYFGNIYGTNSAFFAMSFYNGEIDFATGPVGAYDIFVMEAFGTLLADESAFELEVGEYTLDTEYTGEPLKFIEGDPTEGSYKGTFYRKVDEAGNDVGYAFTGGTIKVSKKGEDYEVTAVLDGYEFNPEDPTDTSKTVRGMRFSYLGQATFDIEPEPDNDENQLDDGQAFYWGDADASGTDKYVINLRQMSPENPDVRYINLALTLYAPKVTYPDPNILIEEGKIPEGTYTLKSDKSAMSALVGSFTQDQYSTAGITYSEIGFEGGPPLKVLVATGGSVTVSYPDGTLRIEMSLDGKDYAGTQTEIGDWWFEGFMPVTDRRAIDHELLTPVFKKARLIYGYNRPEGLDDNAGLAYLFLSSDEIGADGLRYEMQMEVYTHEQSGSTEQNLMLTPVEFTPDTAGEMSRFKFRVGTYDASNKYLYRSWYQQIYTDGETITAPVTIDGGSFNNTNNGSDGSIIIFHLEGKNNRTNRRVKIEAEFRGVIELEKQAAE
ncbi:MAG: hypothetical protein LBV18_05930 [Alistipes sp.]|jgi:hypothetical protein|nr:hypothetical protein [Alistipes sp.]